MSKRYRQDRTSSREELFYELKKINFEEEQDFYEDDYSEESFPYSYDR